MFVAGLQRPFATLSANKRHQAHARPARFLGVELEAGPGSTPSAENALQNLIARISMAR